MSGCPRCGAEVVAGQEYCLDCGVASSRTWRSRCSSRNSPGLGDPRGAHPSCRCGRGSPGRRRDGGRSDRAALRHRDRWLCDRPRVHHPPTSIRGRRRRRRGLACRRGRLDDCARHASADGRPPCRRRASAEGRRTRARRRWGSSTPRSTPASIRATGWCSRGSMDPRPRRRAHYSLHAGSHALRQCAESSPDTARSLSGSATGDPDFVTRPKRRYTPRCGASSSRFSAC